MTTNDEEALMSAPNLGPDQSGSIPYVVTASRGRQATLRRLPSGGIKLESSALAKDGARRIHGVLEFSGERALEGIMAIYAICQRVEREGLP